MEFCDFFVCSNNQEAKAIIVASVVGLIGGLAALIGAIVVGLRQADIIDRQAKIMERALKLEQQRLKSDLYDRRIAIYEVSKTYLRAFLKQAEGGETEDMKLRRERLMFEFAQARAASDFLLSAPVIAHLEHAWVMIGEFYRVGEGTEPHDVEDASRQRHELVMAVRKSWDDLAIVFGPDLTLGHTV